MGRRAKRGVARLEVVAPPPAPRHPPGGDDERSFNAGPEIVRHQAGVLAVRSRVAAAAGGLAPTRAAEPAPERAPEAPEGEREELAEARARLAERTEALAQAEAALTNRIAEL